MSDFNATAVFCEDIREEKAGTHSLIGIFGDTMNVPSVPGMIPKLAVYVRIHFPIDFAPSCDFRLLLQASAGMEFELGVIEQKLIKKTLRDAKKEGAPLAGVYSVMIASPFPVNEGGRMIVVLKWANGEMILGNLNIKVGDPTAAQK